MAWYKIVTHRLCAAVILIFLFATICFAQAPRRYERSLKRNSEQKYLVYVPQNYDPARSYPLLIAIHSKGGPAADQYDQWNFHANRDHYIMLCPQFFGGYQFFISEEDRKLLSMMREMQEEFPYKEDRVFMVGFSTGADFVQKFVFTHPGTVSAAAILAARNYPEPPYSGKAREVKYFVGVGANDDLSRVPSRQFYEQLVRLGYDVQFKEFPSVGFQLNAAMKEAVMDFFKNLND